MSRRMRRFYVSVMVMMALLLSGLQAAAADKAQASPQDVSQYLDGIKGVLPSFKAFGKRQGLRVPLLDQAGGTIGTLLLAPSSGYERKEGYRDVINMAVVLSPDQKVAGIVMGKNRESRKFIQRIRQAGFFKKWNGLSIQKAAALDVDAVTRATYSSEAMKSEVKAVLKAAFSAETKK